MTVMNWWPGLTAPYESLWSILQKLAEVNLITHQKLHSDLRQSHSRSRLRGLRGIPDLRVMRRPELAWLREVTASRSRPPTRGWSCPIWGGPVKEISRSSRLIISGHVCRALRMDSTHPCFSSTGFRAAPGIEEPLVEQCPACGQRRRYRLGFYETGCRCVPKQRPWSRSAPSPSRSAARRAGRPRPGGPAGAANSGTLSSWLPSAAAGAARRRHSVSMSTRSAPSRTRSPTREVDGGDDAGRRARRSCAPSSSPRGSSAARRARPRSPGRDHHGDDGARHRRRQVAAVRLVLAGVRQRVDAAAAAVRAAARTRAAPRRGRRRWRRTPRRRRRSTSRPSRSRDRARDLAAVGQRRAPAVAVAARRATSWRVVVVGERQRDRVLALFGHHGSTACHGECRDRPTRARPPRARATSAQHLGERRGEQRVAPASAPAPGTARRGGGR